MGNVRNVPLPCLTKKKPPRLGHAASVLFDPSLAAQQRKAPFFSGQKVTLLLGFFWIWQNSFTKWHYWFMMIHVIECGCWCCCFNYQIPAVGKSVNVGQIRWTDLVSWASSRFRRSSRSRRSKRWRSLPWDAPDPIGRKMSEEIPSGKLT